MSDFYVGNRATSFSEFPEYNEYTRVSLYYDSETLKATVGNDTGREMVLVSPFLPISTSDCETLAQNILNELSGFKYQPFKATGAELDPSADLGDTLTVGGIESFIGQLDTTFNQAFISDINTPSGDDIEHEYPYVSQEQRKVEREIATTRSMITTTANEIRLEVSNELNDLSSSIDVKLDSITLETIGADGTVSSVKLFDTGKIDLTGYATFTGLSGGTTTIDGACIKTGTISAERINLTGSITWGDLSESVQDKFLTTGEVSTIINDKLVLSPTIAGGQFKNLSQNTWIEIGNTQPYYGLILKSNSFPNGMFGVYDGDFWITSFSGKNQYTFLITDGETKTSNPQGTWDFSSATVTGLGNVKVVPVWG